MNTVEIKAKLENVFKSLPISREQKEALFDIYIELMNAAIEGINPDMTQYAKKADAEQCIYDIPSSAFNWDVSGGLLRITYKRKNEKTFKESYTIPTFKGTNGEAKSGTGLVPFAETTDKDKFLKGDGTWGIPTDTKYNAATKEALGLVKQAATIAPLESEDEIATVISTVNTLIANLKSAGIISNS